MQEHAVEIVQVLVWVLLGGGSAFLAVLGWIGKQLHGELRGIKTQIEETNRTLNAIERDLRDELSGLDRRVTKIETRCDINHGNL
jgi:hypothetical protein